MESIITPLMSDLRFVKSFPDIGHWAQTEAAAQTNQAILKFLSTRPDS